MLAVTIAHCGKSMQCESEPDAIAKPLRDCAASHSGKSLQRTYKYKQLVKGKQKQAAHAALVSAQHETAGKEDDVCKATIMKGTLWVSMAVNRHVPFACCFTHRAHQKVTVSDVTSRS